MSDDIIDLTSYLQPEVTDVPRGAMSLWGADGERSRFALPLWRIIYLAQAERGVIVSQPLDLSASPKPFVALDLGSEPARTEIDREIPAWTEEDQPTLIDLAQDGLLIFLGVHKNEGWTLVVDGGGAREKPMGTRAREDVLFLAGECAGLLFARELADSEE